MIRGIERHASSLVVIVQQQQQQQQRTTTKNIVHTLDIVIYTKM